MLHLLSVNDVRSKWNNVRAQYMRERRGNKKKSGSTTPKWKFFALLTFLQPTIKNAISRMSTEQDRTGVGQDRTGLDRRQC